MVFIRAERLRIMDVLRSVLNYNKNTGVLISP